MADNRPTEPDTTKAPFSDVNAEGDTKTSAQTAAEDTGEVAKQKAAEAFDEAKMQARETGKTLQNQAFKSLDQGRRELAQRAGGLSKALRQSRQNLEEQNLGSVARYADRAAGTVDEVTGYLQERGSQDLLLDLEKAAKREPLLVYGGLFAVGALTVWALKGTQNKGIQGSSQSVRDGATRSDSTRSNSTRGDGLRNDDVRVSEPVPTQPEQVKEVDRG